MDYLQNKGITQTAIDTAAFWGLNMVAHKSLDDGFPKPKTKKGGAGSGYVIPIDMIFGYSKSNVDLLDKIDFQLKTIENLENKLAEIIRR